MKIVHICDGWEFWNGAANIARLIAGEQRAAGAETVLARWVGLRTLRSADVLWLSCSWRPCLWWAALAGALVRRLTGRPRIVWMPEGSYDPVRLKYHGWKKALAGALERLALRRADVAVATCAEEAGWIAAYEPRVRKIETTDIRRFFRLPTEFAPLPRERPVHVLFLGRRHPLKGLDALEEAVRRVQVSIADEERRSAPRLPADSRDSSRGVVGRSPRDRRLELRAESSLTGAALEEAWAWCDVLALPTESDNFGLVVAEALSRGKRVLTTDGAPVWAHQPGVTHVTGYRNAERETRIALLSEGLRQILH